MIYPTLGISIITHIFVIGIAKARNLLGFKMDLKNKKNSISRKIFISLAIAAVVWSVSFVVIGSSIAAAFIGALDDRSNFTIIKNAFDVFENKNSALCPADKQIPLKFVMEK